MPSVGRPSTALLATLAGLGVAAALAIVANLASRRQATPLKAFILIVRLSELGADVPCLQSLKFIYPCSVT